MQQFRTPLTVLEIAAHKYPSDPVFQIPQISESDPERVQEWLPISYAQFQADVALRAKYWTRTLTADGIPPRSVVALWLGGMTYQDVLSIYGILRAGYIPQLFSLRLPNPDVIYDLMDKADAKALICDRLLSANISQCPVPVHDALPESLVGCDEEVLPSLSEKHEGDDIAIIFHTSGSTSGQPKLVHCNFRWLDAIVNKAYHTGKPRTPGKQDVTVWIGSMCHIAQNCMLLGSMHHGSSTIQPTQIAFSPVELKDMIIHCGLNRLYQFATFLATQLRAARKDPELLVQMQNLDEVLYCGLALPHDDEEWAFQHGLRITNMFGNTECGAMLVSVGGKGPDARALRAIEGTSYAFLPVASTTENKHADANSQLLELVILSESGDCPDSHLRAADGHYHTGDLFVEIAPGTYVSRGRDDDWIKSQNSLRCDTKAIEDNVRATCGDLISECIVVGNGRPSPALFVEPKVEIAEEALKKKIIRRTRAFHARRYLHERIVETKFVFVVPRGTLPRTATKGNIRRKAVEESFRDQLDNAFGMSF